MLEHRQYEILTDGFFVEVKFPTLSMSSASGKPTFSSFHLELQVQTIRAGMMWNKSLRENVE